MLTSKSENTFQSIPIMDIVAERWGLVLMIFGNLRRRNTSQVGEGLWTAQPDASIDQSMKIENKLYPDYDDGLYQRMYIELKEEVRV